jgi:hypothetical protein
VQRQRTGELPAQRVLWRTVGVRAGRGQGNVPFDTWLGGLDRHRAVCAIALARERVRAAVGDDMLSARQKRQLTERFLDNDRANEYFRRYFTWYDTEHYHSGIDYVTPQQAHDGLRPAIVERRRVQQLAQRRRRRAENQKQKAGAQKNNQQNTAMPANLVA